MAQEPEPRQVLGGCIMLPRTCDEYKKCCCGCADICGHLLAFIYLIVTFIFLLIFYPNDPKFHVDNATLTRFTISPTNNTLYYNLAFNMSFRNPNRRSGVYYDFIEVNAAYHGKSFARSNIPGFYLGHKSGKDDVNIVLKGEQSMVLNHKAKSKFDMESKDEVYKIYLKLRFMMAYKYLRRIRETFKSGAACDLKIPLSYEGKVPSWKFNRTMCSFMGDPHM